MILFEDNEMMKFWIDHRYREPPTPMEEEPRKPRIVYPANPV